MENKRLNPSREDNIYRLFESVVPDFHKAKKGVGGWMTARCPLHKDKNPSFSFNFNGGWNCFAGCGKGDAATLAEKLGLDPKPYYTHIIDIAPKAAFKPVLTRSPISAVEAPAPAKYIDIKTLHEDLENYDINNYALFLKEKFGATAAEEIFYTHYVGTYISNDVYNGAAIFFFVDIHGQICSKKIMQYDRNGNRIKKPFNLIKQENPESYKKCLYNERFTALSSKEIAIVESEKTANIMSLYRPDFIWLATGGNNRLNPLLLEPLLDRKIALFPDQGSYENWKKIADENPEYKMDVSRDCEIWFENQEIKEKQDIADYYLKNHNLRWDAEWDQAEYDSIFN